MDLIAESNLAAGRKAEASAGYQRVIQARKAAGQKAPEEVYQKAVQLAYDAKAPNAVQMASDWVAAYPSANSWHNTIAIYRNFNRPDAEGTLDLLRLLQAAGALTTPGDYALFVEAAADQMNFNEAQAVLNAGIAAKVVDPSNSNFRDMITVLKKKPIATDADLETAMKSSPSALICYKSAIAISEWAIIRRPPRYIARSPPSRAPTRNSPTSISGWRSPAPATRQGRPRPSMP